MIPLRYNVRSLLVRRTTSLATLIGIALVVFVLAAALMLSAGINRTLQAAGSPDNAIVLRKGADGELSSNIETGTVSLILAAPGVKHDKDNKPLGAGEILAVIALDKAGTDGEISNVGVRGVADNVMTLRPETHIVAGRPAKPGSDEVIIGQRIRGRFAGVELGLHCDHKKNRPVTVVGVFEAGGSSFESEVWADIDTVRSSFGREALVSSVTVVLESPTKYDGFEVAVEQDKRLGLDVQREQRYYESQSEQTGIFITALGVIISFFFILAAVIGAFITMNTAVAHRHREIGTLRALGFSRLSVLASFLFEGVTLAATGAAVGVIAAYFLSFVRFSMMNFATWSEVVFSFTMTPGVVITAVLVGAITGLIGGLIPAVRAARMRPIDALRG
jgi:putative ABC transport system permease protein